MIDKPHADFPLGLYFAFGAKYYYGALTHALRNQKIDRYFSILLLLAKSNKRINQQDLGQCMQVDKVSMVRILDYLERAGLIHREINPQDRREKFIQLTESGYEEVGHIQKAVKKINRDVFSVLNKAEVDQFMDIMDKILGHVKNLPSQKVVVKYKPGQPEEKDEPAL